VGLGVVVVSVVVAARVLVSCRRRFMRLCFPTRFTSFCEVILLLRIPPFTSYELVLINLGCLSMPSEALSRLCMPVCSEMPSKRGHWARRALGLVPLGLQCRNVRNPFAVLAQIGAQPHPPAPNPFPERKGHRHLPRTHAGRSS